MDKKKEVFSCGFNDLNVWCSETLVLKQIIKNDMGMTPSCGVSMSEKYVAT